jgi:uncharacterized protein YeaO (DUF488 family)
LSGIIQAARQVNDRIVKGDSMIYLKRAYEDASPDDGERILVERLWPRGLAKEESRFDAWEKVLAPSAELRKWYGHVVERWPEFQRRYREELSASERQVELEGLAERARRGTITFVYAAKDTEHNGAVVLKDYVERHFGL